MVVVRTGGGGGMRRRWLNLNDSLKHLNKPKVAEIGLKLDYSNFSTMTTLEDTW